jgi:4-amino-4-deoxy-L-arabinose transferase-like glycosyltransferase
MLLWSIVLAVIAGAVRAPLLGQGIAASDTTGFYLPVARGLFHGQGFPNNFRPPAFPLLLASIEGLGIGPVSGVVVLQNLIGIVLPAFVLLVGWRFFSQWVGVLAGFLTAASPLMIVTEQVALPDYLFGIASLVGAVLLAEAALRLRAHRISWRLPVAVGATFGVATLFRPNGQLAVLVIPAALLLGARNWRIGLRSSAIALAALLCVLAPWVLHNIIAYGDPQVATEGGVSLYGRVITSERRPPPADSPDGRLALSVYNTGGPTVAVLNALVGEGKTISEAAGAMGALGREAILEDPGSYLADTWGILGQYISAYDPDILGTNSSGDQISIIRREIHGAVGLKTMPGDSVLTRLPWQAAQIVNGLLFIVTLGGALILLMPFVGRSRARLASATFLLVAGLGLILEALVVRFELRFDTVFAPIAWILFAAAAVFVGELLVSIVRERTWRRIGDRLRSSNP